MFGGKDTTILESRMVGGLVEKSANIINGGLKGEAKSLNDEASEIDILIGANIKRIRLMLGLTQHSISALLDVTFQQIQKYEKGLNRISASALEILSRKLGVKVVDFFPSAINTSGDSRKLHVAEDRMDFNFGNMLQNKEFITLCRYFHGIKQPAVRKRVIALIMSLSDSGVTEAGSSE